MAIIKPPNYQQRLKAKSMSAVAIVAIIIAVAIAGCSSNGTATSTPQVGDSNSQSQSEEKDKQADDNSTPSTDNNDEATTDEPKTMTKADRATRDSLIMDIQARGFSYLSDQTKYNPDLDTTDTGGLSTKVFSFVVEVGDCAQHGEITYTQASSNAAKFLLDDWTAKLTLDGKTVSNTWARMSMLTKRAYLWKNSHPELYECLAGKPSN